MFSLTLLIFYSLDGFADQPGLEGRSVAGSQEVNCVCSPVLKGGLGKEFSTNVVTKDDSLIISSKVAVLEGNKDAFILSSVQI